MVAVEAAASATVVDAVEAVALTVEEVEASIIIFIRSTIL